MKKKRKRIFIVAPSGAAPETDVIHHICLTTKNGDLYDIYGMDEYRVLATEYSLKSAKKVAIKLGAKRPPVI